MRCLEIYLKLRHILYNSAFPPNFSEKFGGKMSKSGALRTYINRGRKIVSYGENPFPALIAEPIAIKILMVM